jgi:DNA-binding NtrC family response regulator
MRPRSAGLTILRVDDDLGSASRLPCCRYQGCTAVARRPPRSTRFRIAGTQHFDLVVSDVVMPTWTGYDLYMELKERRPDLPVILMTATSTTRDHVIKRSKLAGLATGVLYKKPIDLERLKTIIHTHCFPKEAHDGEAASPDGTRRFRDAHAGRVARRHFRTALGEPDGRVARARHLPRRARRRDRRRLRRRARGRARLGTNLVDTAANYRAQRSERVIGARSRR